MHSDQFKPKSYLNITKYIISEGEQFPLRGKEGVIGEEGRGSVEPLIAVVLPLSIFSVHRYFQEGLHFSISEQIASALTTQTKAIDSETWDVKTITQVTLRPRTCQASFSSERKRFLISKQPRHSIICQMTDHNITEILGTLHLPRFLSPSLWVNTYVEIRKCVGSQEHEEGFISVNVPGGNFGTWRLTNNHTAGHTLWLSQFMSKLSYFKLCKGETVHLACARPCRF